MASTPARSASPLGPVGLALRPVREDIEIAVPSLGISGQGGQGPGGVIGPAVGEECEGGEVLDGSMRRNCSR